MKKGAGGEEGGGDDEVPVLSSQPNQTGFFLFLHYTEKFVEER